MYLIKVYFTQNPFVQRTFATCIAEDEGIYS